MKKLLLLTTCLLSGLMAADTSALDAAISRENSKGACYALVNEFNENAVRMTKVSGDRQGHTRIAFDCQYNELDTEQDRQRKLVLNAFYTGRNPKHMEARGEKICRLTVELSKLEDENSKLLDAIRAHPGFFHITVRGALFEALTHALSFDSLDKKKNLI